LPPLAATAAVLAFPMVRESAGAAAGSALPRGVSGGGTTGGNGATDGGGTTGGGGATDGGDATDGGGATDGGDATGGGGATGGSAYAGWW
jgi:hypothetical protein